MFSLPTSSLISWKGVPTKSDMFIKLWSHELESGLTEPVMWQWSSHQLLNSPPPFHLCDRHFVFYNDPIPVYEGWGAPGERGALWAHC